jgi:YVTN family beta-propeller protein
VALLTPKVDAIVFADSVSYGENGWTGGIAVSPNGSTVYVGDSEANNNDIFVINTSTDTITQTVPVGNEADAVAVSPDGKYVYVANLNTGTVSVIYTGA